MDIKDVIYDAETERVDKINEDITLIQKKRGLTFGTDAYLLSAFAKASKYGSAADLGSGTGVIALLCATKGKYKKVYAVEVQREFASLIERNVALNSQCDNITVINADVRDLSQRDTCGEVDCVLMNPPYMKNNSGLANEHDEKNIARREVLGTIYDFCKTASNILKSGGGLFAVHRPERLIDLTDAMRCAGVEPKKIVFIHPDAESEPSLVLVEGKKGAASSLIVTRPLIVYKDGTREYTEDMQRIYDEFSMSHITER
ncbi:MAG: methyltransferase [Clostridia bacterium]|nr:methyltransferase [Clostridia bacterium]